LAPGSQFSFSVFAIDNYFTGNVTDAITDMTYTLGTPAFTINTDSSLVVPSGGRKSFKVSRVSGGASASPSQTGLLLLYRDSQPNQEADTISLSH
jgi:hypothetical protein